MILPMLGFLIQKRQKIVSAGKGVEKSELFFLVLGV
jgi:hypothetical protein